MLSLLFNTTFWYGLLAAAIVIAIIWICGKYPSARVFVATAVIIIISVVLLGTSIYCGVNLNAYYNETGGIFGAITGIYDTNTSEVNDEFDIKITNLELTQSNGDTYTATVMIDEVFTFEDDTQYAIYINDNFVNNISSPIYARAEYTYQFQNNSLTELLTDTLILDFAFYNNSTTLIITTNGGSDAVGYWNSYFNNNNFVISIKESTYNPGTDLTYSDGEFGEYYYVNFYAEDGYLYSKLYKENSTVTETYTSSDGRYFMGWSLTENGDIISSDYKITEDTNLYAILKLRDTWSEVTFTRPVTSGSGISVTYDVRNIWTDGVNYYMSVTVIDTSASTTTYYQLVLDVETRTWSNMTWQGFSNIIGQYVWTNGTNYYYSNGTDQYILDIATHTWSPMTWYGLTDFYGSSIWTDGINYYYSYYGGAENNNQYILDFETYTWSPMTWYGCTEIWGSHVWTDGVNYYYSNGSNQYVLDVTTHTWSPMVWNGISSVSGYYIWTDGVNYYYSLGTTQYILDITTHTWSPMTWYGLTNFYAQEIWTDGVNYYWYFSYILT